MSSWRQQVPAELRDPDELDGARLVVARERFEPQ
jgi:hypothetical protein